MLSKKSPFCRWVPWIALLGETWSRFRLWRSLDPSLDSHAAGANWGVTGGPMERSAKVLRFCTIAARWNRHARRTASKPRAFKSVVDLEVSKAHLDALTFIP
jgi:hypothetical protein